MLSKPYNVAGTLLPLLTDGTVKHREVKKLFQSHTGCETSWNSKPCDPTSEPTLLATILSLEIQNEFSFGTIL